MKGFEPSTFAMARRRSSQLSYIRERRGHSNRSKIGASLERVVNGGAERTRIWRLYLRGARRGFDVGLRAVYQVRARRPL